MLFGYTVFLVAEGVGDMSLVLLLLLAILSVPTPSLNYYKRFESA